MLPPPPRCWEPECWGERAHPGHAGQGLTERQRRLWLGAEARELGAGGAVVVASAVEVAADTVRQPRGIAGCCWHGNPTPTLMPRS
jgi:hypothetical protein